MYIPKNRIITNLQTPQNEFVYKGTSVFYNGFYWKSYDGKFFTGKNPNETPSVEIEQIISLFDPENTIQKVQTSVLSIDFVDENIDYGNIYDYFLLKNQNVNSPEIKFLPSQYYPTPTPSDYNLGVFTRYFVVKANENIYLEVNEDTFNNIQNKSADWAWELYTPFSLPWTLTGERDTVFITNRNITQLTEQRLKRRGLQEFLKSNYLKFYKTDEEKNIS
jgi:hypothetical protein